MKAYFNDESLEEKDIAISPDDLIVQRGVGIFDFFRVVQSKPLFVEDHLRRFIKSAELAKIPLRWSFDELEEKIRNLIKTNQKETGGIKLILSGGVSPMGFEVISPNLIIIQKDVTPPPKEEYEKGVKIITCDFLRELPVVKTTNYFNSVWLYDQLKKNNAIDTLYHHEGFVHELSRSNIFLVKDSTLITPDSTILSGVTRSKILEIAKGIMELDVRAVKMEELETADEVFISGTLKKVMPVVNIDGRVVGDGKPGVFTNKLLNAFDAFALNYLNY